MSSNAFLLHFQVIPITCFESQSSDGQYVPILPGGKNMPLTFHNRKEYVERALLYRMNEFYKQVSLCKQDFYWLLFA